MRLPSRMLFSLVCLFVLAPRAALAEPGVLAVHIAGLQEVSGNVFVAIYDSKDTWLSDDTVQDRKVTISEALQDGLVQTSFELPPGEYALTVFYDRDDDGELDTNFIGIPKEPIALSNNAKAKFGPPKFVDAAFQLGEEGHVQLINMEQL